MEKSKNDIKLKNNECLLIFYNQLDEEVKRKSMTNRIENDEVHVYNLHKQVDFLFDYLKLVEEEFNYFSTIETVGVGIYEFQLSEYFRPNYEVEMPEGIFVRTDERCSLLENGLLSAVYIGLVKFANYKLNNK